MSYVLSDEGQQEYGQTFAYLAGEKLDWAARGLARLKALPKTRRIPNESGFNQTRDWSVL
jgi:hypothetical protein